jgi:hypothetical protein
MSLFKDFGKPAKDLLGKNYNYDKHKVELSSKTGDVKFDSEWTSGGKGKLEGECKISPDMTGTLECLTDGKITGTVKIKNLFPGATTKLKGSTANTGFFGLEYAQDWGTLTSDVSHNADKGYSEMTSTAMFNHRNFLVGGSVQLGFRDASMSVNRYDIGLGYAEKGKFEATTLVSEDCSGDKPPKLMLQYIHFVDSKWTYGAKFETPLAADLKPDCELGGTFTVSSDTKVGAKITNTGLLGMYLLTKPDANVTLTHALQLDVNNRSAPHKFGFGIKLSH